MKFNRFNFKIVLVMVVLLLSIVNQELFAQIGLPDDGTVDDVPEAPINAFIGVAMAVGGYFGVRAISRK